MRSLVVGVDGSDQSVRALRYAARLARDLAGGEVIVVYARHIPAFWLPNDVAEDEFADVLDRAEVRVQEIAVAELAECAIPWRVEVRKGEPSEVLCAVARQLDGEALVVVGRSGWSAVHELVLGSVSNRLVHRDDCAVVLVP